MKAPDAVVIGAGVIGAATAYVLSCHGLRVRVIEAAHVGAGASGAAEGLVGSITKRKAGPVTQLVIESFRAFPGLAEELGVDVEFVPKPGLMAIVDEADLPTLARFVERKRAAGLAIELLDAKAARAAEPLLAEDVVGAIYTPHQGMVNPLRLARAYLAAAGRLGATVTTGLPATGFAIKGSRVAAVATPDGAIPCALAVNAAGSAAERVAALAGTAAPILAKRAQMLVSAEIAPGTLRNAVYCAGGMVSGLHPVTLEFEDAPADERARVEELHRPWQLSSFAATARGNVLFCGGFGFAGTTTAVDPRAVGAIAANAGRIVPAFRSLRVLRAWAQLEPCTPDNAPIVGRAPELDNFYQAAGHGNAGVMMSPFTGRILGDLIAGKGAHPLLAALSPARFEGRRRGKSRAGGRGGEAPALAVA